MKGSLRTSHRASPGPPGSQCCWEATCRVVLADMKLAMESGDLLRVLGKAMYLPR